MRVVEPLYSKITNPTSIDNGRGSLPSIQELYKGLSLTSQFKVSLDLRRGFRGSDSVDGHLTRCGIFDEYNSTSYSYDFFASEAILPGVNFDMTEMPGAYQGMLEYIPTQHKTEKFCENSRPTEVPGTLVPRATNAMALTPSLRLMKQPR